MISKYVPSEEFPTYADYRRAKQREANKAWKKRNATEYLEKENARRRRKYAADQVYADLMREKALKTYRADPEKVKARTREYVAANAMEYKAYFVDYRIKNKASVKEYKAAWAKRNSAHVNNKNSQRRARCARATPGWADMESIKDVYMEAKYMQMHVDHIVPLNHPLVCGLHVWENLQLLYPEDNLRKNNTFNPETYSAS